MNFIELATRFTALQTEEMTVRKQIDDLIAARSAVHAVLTRTLQMSGQAPAPVEASAPSTAPAMQTPVIGPVHAQVRAELLRDLQGAPNNTLTSRQVFNRAWARTTIQTAVRTLITQGKIERLPNYSIRLVKSA